MRLRKHIIFAWVFLLCKVYFGVHAQDTPPQDLYCGDQNCYDGKIANFYHFLTELATPIL